MTQWQPIETAPTLDRILVAGWQKRSGSIAGYWWKYEDMTDEKGVPMEHPKATKWMPWPDDPEESGGE